MTTDSILEKLKPVSFGTEIHSQISSFCVIAWKRRDNPPDRQYLYIFPSVRGYHGVYDNKTLGIIELLKKRDTIEIFSCKDELEMRKLAARMIYIFQPKYNNTEPSRADGPIKCRKCGEEFKQNRFWQKDCPKCKA